MNMFIYMMLRKNAAHSVKIMYINAFFVCTIMISKDTCTIRGICYVLYPEHDLPFHDLHMVSANTFEECSTICED